MESFFCFWINLFVDVPQGLMGFVFGLFGAEAPNIFGGVKSFFGCNV